MSDEYNKVLENFLASESPEEFKSTLYNLIADYQNRLGSELNFPVSRHITAAAKQKMTKYTDRLSAPEVSADELDAIAEDFFNTDWTWGGMDLRTRSDVRPKKLVLNTKNSGIGKAINLSLVKRITLTGHLIFKNEMLLNKTILL